MTLDLDAVGRVGEVAEHTWSSDDTLLYALGVGAGQDDPLAELAFTTENTAGVRQQVLPTFAVILTQFSPRISFGEYDKARLVHAEQSLSLRRPLPPAGRIRLQSRVTGMFDKGSGGLVVTETSGWLPEDAPDSPSVTTRSSAFIRGEGGFGIRQPGQAWARPGRSPDLVLRYGIRPDQALLYRLSGDRNPLHSDPAFAAQGGFPRPILHGMCTYGVTARVLLRELAGGDPARFESMAGRFSKPVYPGDTLAADVWLDGNGASFQVRDGDGDVVLDRGLFCHTG
ncbi:MAG TPA: MaoC/PaaZ C-terminal domain-containing protein [Amycolatopsis sp.]|nr:MaoC/PaaZ C-terminal domain-containing protein [Amycolatopsis sp.]